MKSIDSFKTRTHLNIKGTHYHYFSLAALATAGLPGIDCLPFSLKILLENLLRYEDNKTVTRTDIEAMCSWTEKRTSNREIAYRPARILLQDFTGVPAVVDLSAMRDAIRNMGGNPERINPLTPVDLVIDHSIQVDAFGEQNALQTNTQLEMQRNHERYAFLRWGQNAFRNFKVVPPETGICHQVNLEYLAKTVWHEVHHGINYAYPDTLVGTDSHTTMVNGVGVLGWGVGGIEAEAAMLGQPISMLIPEVIGVKLFGKLLDGVTATDLVLTITQVLRQKGVVGKFVEFFGPGLADLPVADRATVANMAPEYGATCGFFPIDEATLNYLHITGREEHAIELVEAYAKAQGLWYSSDNPAPLFTDIVEIDLNAIEPCLSGPKRPQDRVALACLKTEATQLLEDLNHTSELNTAYPTPADFKLHHGDVVIAAITSCTNTSNPYVLMAAGLVAKKAVEAGLQRKPWVKSSLAPGSQVVSHYLKRAGLQTYLDQLGFETVGYGCTTCIGNSGPLPDAVANTIAKHDLVVSAVLSGNRNFEGRIHPQIKANWLASPPLVVAFALTGTTLIDLSKEPIGTAANGQPVYLKEIWPSNAEVAVEVAKVSREMFREQYANVFAGQKAWQAINIPAGNTYQWQADSTYIQRPPFFADMDLNTPAIKPIEGARILAIFGDSITTDHISPAGSIKIDSPAGCYLREQGVAIADFNSYGARRGNHEVMMRGTFANIRIKNEMVHGVEGGMTMHYPSQQMMSIYDAAMRYQTTYTPLIIVAGKEYGTGSSRDWAAKGPKLLGIRAVMAESFERIHRSNLIGMGILPLQFKTGDTRKTLNLNGTEFLHVLGLTDTLKAGADIPVLIERQDGTTTKIMTLCRIDTQNEVEYYRNGGILQFVLRKLVNSTEDDSEAA